MTATLPGTGASRLGRLAQRARADAEERLERCELCGEAIPSEHRHVVDLRTGELKCSCRACALLFDRDGANSGHFRAVRDRRLALPDLRLGDERWAETGIPVDMAFFQRSSVDGRVRALYPSPAGATEATFDEGDWWRAVEADNPQLSAMAEDVEVLLVDRVRGRRRHWIVPLDDAYRLVAIVRMHWRGFTGGKEAWERIDEFFDELTRTARPAPVTSDASPAGGGKEAT